MNQLRIIDLIIISMCIRIMNQLRIIDSIILMCIVYTNYKINILLNKLFKFVKGE